MATATSTSDLIAEPRPAPPEPRRFNPGNEPWLPFYQTTRSGWRCRALYSNTALAHRLGRTRDWIVIYFEDGITSGQRTVVTETARTSAMAEAELPWHRALTT